MALTIIGRATSFHPPQFRSARIACNLMVNSVVAAVGLDHVCWRNLSPGPSHRDVSDARNNADTSLRRAGWRVVSSNGNEFTKLNRAVCCVSNHIHSSAIADGKLKETYEIVVSLDEQNTEC